MRTVTNRKKGNWVKEMRIKNGMEKMVEWLFRITGKKQLIQALVLVVYECVCLGWFAWMDGEGSLDEFVSKYGFQWMFLLVCAAACYQLYRCNVKMRGNGNFLNTIRTLPCGWLSYLLATQMYLFLILGGLCVLQMGLLRLFYMGYVGFHMENGFYIACQRNVFLRCLYPVSPALTLKMLLLFFWLLLFLTIVIAGYTTGMGQHKSLREKKGKGILVILLFVCVLLLYSWCFARFYRQTGIQCFLILTLLVLLVCQCGVIFSLYKRRKIHALQVSGGKSKKTDYAVWAGGVLVLGCYLAFAAGLQYLEGQKTMELVNVSGDEKALEDFAFVGIMRDEEQDEFYTLNRGFFLNQWERSDNTFREKNRESNSGRVLTLDSDAGYYVAGDVTYCKVDFQDSHKMEYAERTDEQGNIYVPQHCQRKTAGYGDYKYHGAEEEGMLYRGHEDDVFVETNLSIEPDRLAENGQKMPSTDVVMVDSVPYFVLTTNEACDGQSGLYRLEEQKEKKNLGLDYGYIYGLAMELLADEMDEKDMEECILGGCCIYNKKQHTLQVPKILWERMQEKNDKELSWELLSDMEEDGITTDTVTDWVIYQEREDGSVSYEDGEITGRIYMDSERYAQSVQYGDTGAYSQKLVETARKMQGCVTELAAIEVSPTRQLLRLNQVGDLLVVSLYDSAKEGMVFRTYNTNGNFLQESFVSAKEICREEAVQTFFEQEGGIECVLQKKWNATTVYGSNCLSIEVSNQKETEDAEYEDKYEDGTISCWMMFQVEENGQVSLALSSAELGELLKPEPDCQTTYAFHNGKLCVVTYLQSDKESYMDYRRYVGDRGFCLPENGNVKISIYDRINGSNPTCLYQGILKTHLEDDVLCGRQKIRELWDVAIMVRK